MSWLTGREVEDLKSIVLKNGDIYSFECLLHSVKSSMEQGTVVQRLLTGRHRFAGALGIGAAPVMSMPVVQWWDML